jgi:hypothetical protein
MKTVNSLSGGKTSSYIAVNYPADYNVFALVRTNDKKCLFEDCKIRQIVSDKIGREFIGTLEEDTIIYTMLDLEQYLGKEIIWLSEKTFDEVISDYKMANGKNYLPNQVTRFCTVDMKIKPIAQWCYENTELPVQMRIGFRANEVSRANRMIERQIDGIENFKFKVGNKNGRNKWKELPYRITEFPLIKDAIFKDTIENFWKDKPVRFAYQNNCVGCFHRNELMLKHMSNKAEKQFNWFIEMEQKNGCTFKSGITYEKIKNYKTQLELFDNDFTDCDSGYCGL